MAGAYNFNNIKSSHYASVLSTFLDVEGGLSAANACFTYPRRRRPPRRQRRRPPRALWRPRASPSRRRLLTLSSASSTCPSSPSWSPMWRLLGCAPCWSCLESVLSIAHVLHVAQASRCTSKVTAVAYHEGPPRAGLCGRARLAAIHNIGSGHRPAVAHGSQPADGHRRQEGVALLASSCLTLLS